MYGIIWTSTHALQRIERLLSSSPKALRRSRLYVLRRASSFSWTAQRASIRTPFQLMMETLRLRAIVEGRVQGVGYRFFVQDHAWAWGLRGYVRNLPGGYRVEVVAEGGRPALEAFLAQLRRGPVGGRVEEIETDWSPASGEYRDFSVSL